MQLFPYHLAEFVCRVLRVTPFRYYCELLYAVMREERSFDYIPNFTVSPFTLAVNVTRRRLCAGLRPARWELCSCTVWLGSAKSC